MQYPKLDEPSVRVLRIIKERGVINGSQLLSETGLKMEDIIPAIGNLAKSDLISIKGSYYNPSDFLNCYFNVRPSNFGLSDFLLKTS